MAVIDYKKYKLWPFLKVQLEKEINLLLLVKGQYEEFRTDLLNQTAPSQTLIIFILG